MWVEFGDDIDDAITIGGCEAVELGATQSPTRRIDVDTDESSYPWFRLEHLGDE